METPNDTVTTTPATAMTTNTSTSHSQPPIINVVVPQYSRIPAPEPFSYQAFVIMDVSIAVVALGTFSTFGVISNILNMAVFYRQGIFTSSTNVNLFGLAVMSFFGCALVLVRAVCWGLTYYSQHGARPSTVHSLAMLIGNVTPQFLNATFWITAVTSFERVFSIIFPFKVKEIFTPYRSLILVIVVIIGTFIINMPPSLQYYLAWEIHPVSNKSYLHSHYSHLFSAEIHHISFLLSPTSLQFSAICIVLICNIIMFWKLRLSHKFRKTATSVSQTNENQSTGKSKTKTGTTSDDVNTSKGKSSTSTRPTSSATSKETKLLRMIFAVSFVFVVCNSWVVPTVIMYYFVYEYWWDIHYYASYIVYDAIMLSEVVCPSINCIIYYTMSTLFRDEFNKMISCGASSAVGKGK